VLNGIEEAKKNQATTIAFTGFSGGRLGPMVDINIHVDSAIIEHVEDIHLMLEHMIVKTIKDHKYSESDFVGLMETQPVGVMDA
jgi:D-sedoheptulose 7-phosphate isomerase